MVSLDTVIDQNNCHLYYTCYVTLTHAHDEILEFVQIVFVFFNVILFVKVMGSFDQVEVKSKLYVTVITDCLSLANVVINWRNELGHASVQITLCRIMPVLGLDQVVLHRRRVCNLKQIAQILAKFVILG